MDNKFKLYTKIVLLLTLILLVFPISALLIVDPLQIFHKPWVRETYFSKELRVQAAGIINNSEFDSIILGTSIASNFFPSESSQLWKSEFVNISPRGAWLSERSLMLNYALKKKQLKYIIISLDLFSEYGKDRSGSSFDYLYNDSRLDDLKVYLGSKYMKYLFCSNLFLSDNQCDDVTDLESVAEWASSKKFDRRFGGLDNWLKAKNDRQIRKALTVLTDSTNAIRNGNPAIMGAKEYEDRIKDIEVSFEEYVLKYVKSYPETTFYLFFPPYSRMRYAIWEQAEPGEFKIYINKIRHIANEADKYGNAKLFAFDHLEFLDDIANYRDTVHFHPRFSSKILRWMKEEEHSLTKDNVEKYIDRISTLAENYDVVSIGEMIEQGLH